MTYFIFLLVFISCLSEARSADLICQTSGTEMIKENKMTQTTQNDEFNDYMKKLNEKLMKVWMPPHRMKQMPRILFKIHRDGHVSDIKVLESGGSAADAAAILAIQKSNPFDPLPDYTKNTVEISFTFSHKCKEEDIRGIFRQF